MCTGRGIVSCGLFPLAVGANLCRWAETSQDHPSSRVALSAESALDRILPSTGPQAPGHLTGERERA